MRINTIKSAKFKIGIIDATLSIYGAEIPTIANVYKGMTHIKGFKIGQIPWGVVGSIDRLDGFMVL